MSIFRMFYKCIFVFIGITSIPISLVGSESQKAPKWVLVVGGAGYIGGHINEMLYRNGYHTVILDNLGRGSEKAIVHGELVKGNMNDREILHEIFTKYPIDAVMHFAAYTEVGESVTNPLKYYQNNLAATITLLQSMIDHNVKTLIFSSTAAIFGNPKEEYVSEDHPKEPINPYGRSKLMVETVLNDVGFADPSFKYVCLRYFNVAGGDPEGVLKNHKTKEANLIQILLRNIIKDAPITVFGTDYETKDGTGVRDYIHVDDLGQAHIAAMEMLFSGGSSNVYNLGNGNGYSVLEVIAAAEKVTGKKVEVILGNRRAGDPPFLVATSEKAERELHWHPKYASLEKMVEDAWRALN